MKKILFFIFLILFCSVVHATEYPKVIPYVNDFADLLSPAEEQNINQLSAQIEQNTSVEVVIVTVKSTEGQNRIEYANRIGEQNGIGQKDTSNGVVVLWSMDNEKGGAIATGRGIGSVLNDAKVGRIGRETRPLFDQGKYADAFIFIQNEIWKEANGEYAGNANIPQLDWWVWLIIAILIITVLIILSSGGGGSFMAASFIGSSIGRSSGGFGSFGGGGFSGGGAGF